jgi:hypothetical protein
MGMLCEEKRRKHNSDRKGFRRLMLVVELDYLSNSYAGQRHCRI